IERQPVHEERHRAGPPLDVSDPAEARRGEPTRRMKFCRAHGTRRAYLSAERLREAHRRSLEKCSSSHALTLLRGRATICRRTATDPWTRVALASWRGVHRVVELS